MDPKNPNAAIKKVALIYRRPACIIYVYVWNRCIHILPIFAAQIRDPVIKKVAVISVDACTHVPAYGFMHDVSVMDTYRSPLPHSLPSSHSLYCITSVHL